MSEYYAVQRTGASLQHYGVKGMKWGVRRYNKLRFGNKMQREKAEQILSKTYEKSKEKLDKLQTKNPRKYEKFRKEMHKSFRGTDYSPYYSEKAKSLQKRMDKMEDDFWHSPAREKIIKQLAKESAKKYGDGSKASIKQYYYGYKYDDLDQGDSFARYRKQNKKAGAQYAKLEKQYWNELRRLRDNPRY